MRVLNSIGDSLLDFIEENQYGNWLFRVGRLGLFAMLLVVVGKVAAGQFLSFRWDDVLFMASTAMVLLLIAWRWEIGLLVIIGTTAFIVHYRAIPTLSLYHFVPEIDWLEDFRLLIGQGVLLYIMGLYVLSRHVATFRARVATPLSTAILAFMVAVLISAVWTVVFQDVLLKHMVERARAYSYYLTFFATLLCVRSRSDLKFLSIALMVMGIVVSIGMGLQFFSGNSVRLFIGESIRVEGIVGRFATRILPPGTTLIWFLIPPVVAAVSQMKGAGRGWMVLVLCMLSAGLLLTLTRAMWMGTLFGILTMMIVSTRTERLGMVRIFVMFAALIMFLLLLLGAISTASDNYMSTYIERFTSVFTTDAYVESSTVGARIEEIKAAWESITTHPWTGIGIGGIYNYIAVWNPFFDQHEWKGVTYIHNSYVLILTKMGLLGLVPLLVMFVVYFVRAWRIYKSLPEGMDRSLVMGGIGATLSCVIASNLEPDLASPGPASLLGIYWGATEFLRWWHSGGRESSAGRRFLRFPSREGTT